jgi:mono/diheme cytochrome c family protein
LRVILHPFICLALGALLFCGCDFSHGRPAKDSETLAPDEIVDFKTLYAENCAGCHGAEGRGGAAIALADPVYLAVADEAAMRKAIAGGVRGTSMPAFAQSAGGMLTDKQIDVIATQIRSRWGRPGILDGVETPSYTAKSAGDAGRGELAYETYCESCHGAEGRGGQKGSAITDGAFLALVSDQGLRTVVVTGRPELNAPDWRGNVPGKPMAEQEVTDVVAWLASKRVRNPGQPYPAAQNTPAPGAR